MKKLLILIILLQFNNVLYTQPAYDSLRNKVWVTGTKYFSALDSTQLMWLDFRGDTMVIQNRYGIAPPIYYMNGSICDENGDLLFFSNGCEIADSSYNDLLGDLIINNGPDYDRQCDGIFGSPITSGLVILPRNSTEFSMFHIRYRVNEATNIPYPDRLLESKMRYSDEEFELLYTDSLVLEATNPDIFWGNIATVRHGNGNAWWLILPQNISNHYYKFLITEEAVNLHSEQDIGEPSIYQESGGGEAVFSPDGTKYARYLPLSDLNIFDFDRCSGEFSNPIHISIQDTADTVLSTGLAFSQSGRYLYLSSTQFVYQLDMEAADIEASRITVAEYDGFSAPPGFTTRFGKMELGPDGKIYMVSPASRGALHVIEYPDSMGTSCFVHQHKYVVEDAVFSGGLPAFPNFRLGPTDPICELVSQEEVLSDLAVSVYPNPSTGLFNLVIPESHLSDDFKINVFNTLGQRLFVGDVLERISSFDLGNNPKGIYLVVITDGVGDVRYAERLILR